MDAKTLDNKLHTESEGDRPGSRAMVMRWQMRKEMRADLLLRVDDVREAGGVIVTQMRAKLLSLPERLASEIKESDPEGVENVLKDDQQGLD